MMLCGCPEYLGAVAAERDNKPAALFKASAEGVGAKPAAHARAKRVLRAL